MMEAKRFKESMRNHIAPVLLAADAPLLDDDEREEEFDIMQAWCFSSYNHCGAQATWVWCLQKPRYLATNQDNCFI